MVTRYQTTAELLEVSCRISIRCLKRSSLKFKRGYL